MDKTSILWVDLRISRKHVSAYHFLIEDWTVRRINKAFLVDKEIRENAPKLICFEYDYPDITSLSTLQKSRHQFPAIPIIMLTEQHSEALAIWALRLHIWDFFIYPLQSREFLSSVTTILKNDHSIKNETVHLSPLVTPLPSDVRFPPRQKRRTNAVKLFVENHYHEKIYEKEVAQLCGLKIGTFSRYFKKENEMTFREYLINFRINKARKLLRNTNASVTDIAYTVGFHDPSYFTRIFRRIIGMTPSSYQNEHRGNSDGEKMNL